ncbi:putative F-box protein, partial [Tanacetum coccineum]
LDDGKWSKLGSLGDKAVFLGFNSSFAVDAGEGVKADCIYFTDDLYEPYRDLPDGGGGDVGVYNMFDGSIEAIFGSKESVFRGSPPLWLQTSSLPANSRM